MIAFIFHNNTTWRIVAMVLLFALLGSEAYGQGQDSIPKRSEKKAPAIQPIGEMPDFNMNDTSAISDAGKEKKVLDEDHSPTKAMVYALVLPGLGQIYNKKYFKLPFVYGALGGIGYWISYNYGEYQIRMDEYIAGNIDISIVNGWRKRLESSILIFAAAYGLQVIDAYVDANLYYWDVSPDLTMRVEPYIAPISIPGATPVASYGFRLGFTF